MSYRVVSHHFGGARESTLPRARCKEDRLLPMQQVPPLHVVDVVQGKGLKGPCSLAPTRVVKGVARIKLKSTTNCLRDSDSGFDRGV